MTQLSRNHLHDPAIGIDSVGQVRFCGLLDVPVVPTARVRSAVGRIVVGRLVLGAAAVGATPAYATAGDWRQQGFGPSRVFYNPNELTIAAAQRRWTVRLPGGVTILPVARRTRVDDSADVSDRLPSGTLR